MRQKMLQDNVDIRALEFGGDTPASKLESVQKMRQVQWKAPKKGFRRWKKLHWLPISADQLSNINQQTIWEDEMESLFLCKQRKQQEKKSCETLKRKQAARLIDEKRATISLAIVKLLSYAEIGRAIGTLDAITDSFPSSSFSPSCSYLQ